MPSTIEILPKQREFLKNKDRWFGAIGGLGSGKSFVASLWLALRVLEYPRAIHCFAGRDTPQLRRGTIPTIMGTFALLGVPARHIRNDNSIVVTVTSPEGTVDCRLQPLTSENYESFRSLEADSIFADEISDWADDNEPFVRYLAPRLRPSPAAKAAYGAMGIPVQGRWATNPPLNPGHWLFELLEIIKFCGYIAFSTEDNIFLKRADPDYVPNLLRSMSEEEADVLVRGLWGNVTKGRVYKTFDRRFHCTPMANMPPITLDQRLPIQWSLDFNVGYQSSVIGQTHDVALVRDEMEIAKARARGETVEALRAMVKPVIPGSQASQLYIVDEIVLEDAGIQDVVDEFILRYGPHLRALTKSGKMALHLYGDPSGGARSQQLSSRSSARSNYGIICEALRTERISFQIRVMRKPTAVMNRVNATNARFVAADESQGCRINLERCPVLCDDLEYTKYLVGKNDIDKRNEKRTHSSDALGYLMIVEKLIVQRAEIAFATTFL